MGLADFKARLLLFFAGKLREWANSIDENVLSPPPESNSPSHQPFTRVAGGPPQHWIDLVRERAPELLWLTQEYSSEEEPLPEDQVHTYRSDIDDEVEIPGQRAVNVPGSKEDVVRKSEPVSLPPTKVVEQRDAQKPARVKSFLPGRKPLTLKPLPEPNPFLQPPVRASEQRTEPGEPPQLIEVIGQEVIGQDEKTAASPAQSSRGAVEKEHQVATRESTRQLSLSAPRSDEAPAIYRTTKAGARILSVAQAPCESEVTQKSEAQRSVSNVVRKAQSAPRRYLQAIVSLTRKTIRRTARAEDQTSHAITPINLSVNSSSKNSPSAPNVVLFAESSKTQPPAKHDTSSTPIIQRSEGKVVTVVYPRLKAPETATSQASTPTRPKVSMKNVKTASRQPAPAAFPRPVNRFADASNARIQDSFGNMPALMDEEKMNRASSVHLADLRPGKNQWPDLPSATSTEIADELAAHQRDINRMRRLTQEQRGSPWNE